MFTLLSFSFGQALPYNSVSSSICADFISPEESQHRCQLRFLLCVKTDIFPFFCLSVSNRSACTRASAQRLDCHEFWITGISGFTKVSVWAKCIRNGVKDLSYRKLLITKVFLDHCVGIYNPFF